LAAWSLFDNTNGTLTTLPGERSFHLPRRSALASDADYFAATIHAPPDDRKTVTVYVRKEGAAFEIVGIERKL